MKAAGLLDAKYWPKRQQTAPATVDDEAKKDAHDSINIHQCAEFMKSGETMPVTDSPMDKALRLHGFLDKDGKPFQGFCAPYRIRKGCPSQGGGELP